MIRVITLGVISLSLSLSLCVCVCVWKSFCRADDFVLLHIKFLSYLFIYSIYVYIYIISEFAKLFCNQVDSKRYDLQQKSTPFWGELYHLFFALTLLYSSFWTFVFIYFFKPPRYITKKESRTDTKRERER
ncbi:hypothetical protein F4703DRAFT_1898369 [Phycomyces blakesleeanus]